MNDLLSRRWEVDRPSNIDRASRQLIWPRLHRPSAAFVPRHRVPNAVGNWPSREGPSTLQLIATAWYPSIERNEPEDAFAGTPERCRPVCSLAAMRWPHQLATRHNRFEPEERQ
jgi:hypothetical protein